jgi:hypothetical protein
MAFPKRLRPVVVEAAAFGEMLIRTGRSLFERQREALDDLWAEINERATDRMRRTTTNGHRPSTPEPVTKAASADARV